VQKAGAMETWVSGAAASTNLQVTGYKIYYTTACGHVLATQDVAAKASASTCCDPMMYTSNTGLVQASTGLKFILIKPVTAAGAVDAGTKIAVVDEGATAGAGVADSAYTAGVGAAALAALAAAALA